MQPQRSRNMKRYEVIESRVWVRDDGAKASIYGACPWTSDAEKARWKIITQGWTIHDTQTNTVGIGRKPFATREEAQSWCDAQHARMEPFRNGPDTNF